MSHATPPLSARTPSAARNTPAAFGEIDKGVTRRTSADPDFTAIAGSPEFRALRRRLLAFVFPMSAVFLAWYLTYVVMAAWMPDFMSIRLAGDINIGLLMGIGQFFSTIAISAAYLRFTARHIDPRVAELRQEAGGHPR